MRLPTKQVMLGAVVMTVMGGLAAGGLERPGSATELRLYVLECGAIDVLDISFFSPGVDVGESRTLANACYLVVHPEGSLLWDAGLPDALAGVTRSDTLLGNFVMHVHRTLAAQLREVGHAPETMRYLGLSHMHFDHVGNVALFPRATLLLQREEYEAAFGPEPEKYLLDPSTYSALRRNPVELLAGDHDVFGDGTVVIKRALGHTPGHQALYVRLPQSGGIVLSGDVAHFTANWVHRRVPGANFDREESVKTMDALAEFLDATGATLWIQHDPEQRATIRHAPEYYQ